MPYTSERMENFREYLESCETVLSVESDFVLLDIFDHEDMGFERTTRDYDPSIYTQTLVAANDNEHLTLVDQPLGDRDPMPGPNSSCDGRYEIKQNSAGESQAPPELSSDARKALNDFKFNRRITDPVSKRTVLEAIRLVDRGFACVPVHSLDGHGDCTCQGKRKKTAAEYGEEFIPKCNAPGKHPKLDNWQNRAAKNLSRVLHWYSEWLNQKNPTNLGIVTGAAWDILVIDVDGPEGLASLERMQSEAEFGALPRTVTSVTGSGGRHLIFRYPKGWDIRNSASILGGKGSKVDVRGENGFIVAPGSLHKSGKTYEWLEGHSPEDLAPAESGGAKVCHGNGEIVSP